MWGNFDPTNAVSRLLVGAGLLAKAVCQATPMPTDTPLSRASPLPQGSRRSVLGRTKTRRKRQF
ncbi:hypothetical protein EPZ47_01275 [Pseudomonas viciae]|uniref:Uncharacterized protein n=1 Tax=Pseudomonas viciae TaxID=2505979 RepID=A0A4P7PQA8_9PSED|nr:hypothetical protein EPZ47_01275 [Pseudomonas viciae]